MIRAKLQIVCEKYLEMVKMSNQNNETYEKIKSSRNRSLGWLIKTISSAIPLFMLLLALVFDEIPDFVAEFQRTYNSIIEKSERSLSLK